MPALRALFFDICVFAMLSLIAPQVLADGQGGKFALLIQNDAYPEGEPARTAGDDASTLAAVLTTRGFAVALKTNLGRDALRSSIAAFVARLGPQSTALVFYKGVGLQVARQDYLVPVDASIWTEEDVRREGVSLDRLMADLDRRGARVKIAIVDAARPNPFERRFRMYSAGLAPLASPQGSLVIFAEALNKAGDPAKTPVSPFMAELVGQLKVPGNIETAFSRVREGVARATKGRQLPWVSSTLLAAIDLSQPTTTSSPGAAAPPSASPSASTTAAPPAKPSMSPSQAQARPHETATAPAVSPPPSRPPPPSQAPGPPLTAGTQPGVAKPSERPSLETPQPARPPASQSALAAPPSSGATGTPSKPASPSTKPSPPGSAGAKPASQNAAPKLPPGSVFADCRRCPEMIVVPAGSFKMGSGATPFDRPVHGVTIARPFALSLSAVTREDWALCVDAGACKTRPKAEDAGTSPAVDVDWFDAREYVAFLTRQTGQAYRLPTEAEWEYAARGGTTSAFAWGDAAGIGHANCTDCGNKSGRPQIEPVRTYPKNGFGLYDMAGNVAVWLEDCWRLTYRDAPTDGSAPPATECKMRVVRGGSFETTAAYVKPTARFRAAPDAKSASIGFRVVREIR